LAGREERTYAICCDGFIEARCGFPHLNQLINMARSIASQTEAAERGNIQ